MTAIDTTDQPSWVWWEARRLRYNLGLVLAGCAAWALFALECWWLVDNFSISVSVTLAQGLVWLVAVAAANILYLLGPISEAVLRPSDVGAYRRRMFGLGFWASMAAPFLFPALVLASLLAAVGY